MLSLQLLSLDLFAEDTPPASPSTPELSLSLGYNCTYLSYRETGKGIFLNSDRGIQNGGSFGLGYSDDHIFLRIDTDITGSAGTRYKGKTWDGTPLSMNRRELFCLTGMDAGLNVLSYSDFSLWPFIGFGYRYWARGSDSSSDYLQEFSCMYASVGTRLLWTIKFLKLEVSFEPVVFLPVNPEMSTDFAGRYDTMTFSAGSRIGYGFSIPVVYTIQQNCNTEVFIFFTASYERWQFGRSSMIYITKDGALLVDPYNTGGYLAAYEPRSSADIYGFKLGSGVKF